MTAENTCTAACSTLWRFPADPSSTTYNQNERLLPGVTGTTAFTPGGAFGLFTGEFSDVNFSGDRMNIAHDTSGADLTPRQTLHGLRIYPAYGRGHVAIPNTYLVAVDITRVPVYKNDDFQDVVMVLRNAVPAS